MDIFTEEEKVIQKELVGIANESLNKIIKYFKGGYIQNRINQEDKKDKIYLKQHFIKTYNLCLSILILNSCNTYKPLCDEAKIIFRSLFEHIINFVYIYTRDSVVERLSLIKQFYDFVPIARNKYIYSILNEKDENIKQSEEYKIILEQITENTNVEEINDIFDNYNEMYHKNPSKWADITFDKILNDVMTKETGKTFIFYKKYYQETNPFVHCNILGYVNKDGTLIENYQGFENAQILFQTILMVLGYFELYFHLIGIELFEKFPELKTKANSVFEDYHKYKSHCSVDMYDVTFDE